MDLYPRQIWWILALILLAQGFSSVETIVKPGIGLIWTLNRIFYLNIEVIEGWVKSDGDPPLLAFFDLAAR